MTNTDPLPLYDLDESINFYMSANMRPRSQYQRISAIAIRGWRLFYRDSTGAPQTQTLQVLANNTAVLPSGALNKISVGVLNNRGEIASLVYDQLLGLGQSTNPNRLEQPTEQLLATSDEVLFSLQDNGNYGIGYGGFEQLGIGSQPVIGYYNINWETRVMVFNFGHFCPTEVEFTYMGLPDCNGTYLLHPYFQEAMIAYIAWQDSASNPKKGNRAENKRDFDIQYQNARRAMTPFSPSDVYNVVRQSARLAVKS